MTTATISKQGQGGGRLPGFTCTDQQRLNYKNAALKRWADPTYRQSQLEKLRSNHKDYRLRVVQVTVSSRVKVAQLHKVCPRCHSLLLHNYGELECWACGFSQDIKTGQEFGR